MLSFIPCFRFALALLAIASGAARANASPGQLNLGEDGLALEGYDPVSYFQATGPARGDAARFLAVGGAVYRFASDENKALFESEPDRYRPAFGGWCAWAMLKGERVSVDPLRRKMLNGKLLLFYDGFWGDTLAKWNQRAEIEGDNALFEIAHAQWRKRITKQ